jgi:hypothetical protein
MEQAMVRDPLNLGGPRRCFYTEAETLAWLYRGRWSSALCVQKNLETSSMPRPMRVITQRRSRGLGAVTRGSAAIVDELVRGICKRWTAPLGGIAEHRFSNPYFAERASAARSAMPTRGLAPRVLKP